MQEILSEIEAWKARGDRIALATVIDVQRSAPRPPGAKMAVNEHGEIAGSVSGGCVEGAVAEIADEILRDGLFIDVIGPAPRLIVFGAVDIAASLCTLALAAGWRPYVVDPRARFATQ